MEASMSLNLFKKSRKYPIKYNENGESAKKQAFALFGQGIRPSQIFREKRIPVKENTLFRYFEEWKKEKKIVQYSVIKKLRKQAQVNFGEIQGHSQEQLAAGYNIGRMIESSGYAPKSFIELISQIMTMTENTNIEIAKESDQIIIKIERTPNYE
jgi:hypothetical protein